MNAETKRLIYSILMTDFNVSDDKGLPVPRATFPMAHSFGLLSLKKALEAQMVFLQDGKQVAKAQLDANKPYNAYFVDSDFQLSDNQKAGIKALFGTLENMPADATIESLEFMQSL